MDTVRAVVAIAMQHKWTVYQMDIKSTFLNGVLKEEVYVAQLPGYEIEGQEDKLYQLKKALYGLKQAPQTWHSRIDSYFLNNGFDKCDGEPTLYIKESEEVKQTENGIFISQAKYVAEILERFKMQNDKCAPTPTIIGLKLRKEDCSSNVNPTLYKSMIGSLMYLTATRPNIMYEVSLLSRFIETPKETHWQAAKRILSDWAGSVDDIKSTSGYVFHLGSRAISWASKKQPIVSLPTAKAEYVAAIATVCQAVWKRMMLRDLRHDQEGATTIFCNTSAIALSKNFVFHKRTNHIDAKYHFIRELINNDEIVLQHCRSQEHLDDIFTKPLA
eukprot:PITA_03959